MPFSAGTVVLEVWPSFRNVQRAMSREGQALGRQFGQGFDRELKEVEKTAGKRGDKAGGAFASSMKRRLEGALSAINMKIGVDASQAERDLKKLAIEAKAFLKKLKVNIDADPAAALAKIRAFEREAQAIARNMSVDIDVRTNAAAARREFAQMGDDIERMYSRTARERAADLARERAARQAQSDMLRNAARENRDFDLKRAASAKATAAEIKHQNDEIARSYQETAIKAAAAAGLARIIQSETSQRAGITGSSADQSAAVSAIRARYAAEERASRAAAESRAANALKAGAVEALSYERVQRAADSSYDQQTHAAERAAAERMAISRVAAAVERRNNQEVTGPSFLQAAWLNNIGQAANSFRLFNGALLTAVTIGPLLVPILASIAAGLGGIAVAAVAAVLGVGVLIAGLAGIGGALQAMSALDKEKQKQSTGSKSLKNPTAPDRRGLRDAQIALARARQDAGQRIAAADRQVEQAEQSLASAQKQAKAAQDALTRARKDAAEQLVDLNNQLIDGKLQQEQATLDLQEAAAQYNAVLEDPQATNREKEQARITYEQQQQQYKELVISNQRLQEQTDDANKKGVEGSDQVVQAKQQITQANQQVRSSEQDLADAQKGARQARIEESRTLADAERRVADAQVDLRQKTVQTGIDGTTAMDNLNYAMSQLSPTGQEFARFLYGLKPLLDEIRGAAQKGLLPGVQRGISLLVKTYGPEFVKFVGTLAKVLGDLFFQGSKALTAPWWHDFFRQIAAVAPKLLGLLGQIFLDLAEGFAGVLEAFIPYAPEFLKLVLELTGAFADWGKSLGGSKGFQTFITYVRKEMPKIVTLFGLVLDIVLKLLIGLAPYIDKLLDFFIKGLGWLAQQSPEKLAKMALAIGAIVGSIQILAGLFAGLSSVIGLIAGIAGLGGVIGPVAIAIGAITAAILAFTALSVKFGPRTALDIMVPAVGIFDTLKGIISGSSEAIQNFLSDNAGFVAAMKGYWQDFQNDLNIVLLPINSLFRNILGPTIKWFWESIVKPTFDFVIGIVKIAWGIFQTFSNIIIQIFTKILAPVFKDWYDQHIKPIWENNLRPVFQALADFIEKDIAPAWQRGLDALGKIWAGLIDLAKMPVEFVVNTVINKGIIDTFNKLADKFPGLDPVKHVELPASWNTAPSGTAKPGPGRGRTFARGGVLPGYTPGRDVHTFFSPTAGTLELSGGEPILRPEAGRVLGRGWVDGINAAARSGGVGGVENFLGGFKSGGVLGVLDDVLGTIGGAAGDVVSAVLAAPGKALKGIVNGLIGPSPKGLLGVGKAMVEKVIDAIVSLISGGGQQSGPTGPSNAMGYRAQEAIIRAAFPGESFSSDYRPGSRTLDGSVSYHSLGRAVDIVPPSMAIFNWLLSHYRNSSELLYSPAGDRQILRGGNQGDTSGALKAQHYSHIHWAMKTGGLVPNLYDNGGALPPGISLVANRTGKPEQVFTAEQFASLRDGSGPTYIFEGGQYGYDPEEIADRVEDKRRKGEAIRAARRAESLVG
jgi:hypothetical protein